MMNRSFIEDLNSALDAVHYMDENDNEKLRSAIRDLSTKFPDEKKLFLRNADDQFLKMCCSAANGSENQQEVLKQKTADYLHAEYLIDNEFAYDMADMVVTAFAKNKSQRETTNGQKFRHEMLIEEMEDQANATINSAVVGSVEKKDTRLEETEASTKHKTEDNSKGKRTRRRSVVLIIAAILLVIGGLLFWIIGPNDKIEVSPNELFLSNIGDHETIEPYISGMKTNLSEWDYQLEYDEDKIKVEWEEEFTSLIVTRVGEGETELKIYAVSVETKERIDVIDPAYVIIHDKSSSSTTDNNNGTTNETDFSGATESESWDTELVGEVYPYIDVKTTNTFDILDEPYKLVIKNNTELLYCMVGSYDDFESCPKNVDHLLVKCDNNIIDTEIETIDNNWYMITCNKKGNAKGDAQLTVYAVDDNGTALGNIRPAKITIICK